MNTKTSILRHILAVLCASAFVHAHAAELPRGFLLETLATNLNAATAIAPSSDGRIFIADQTGKILLWKNEASVPKIIHTLHVTDYWERGLIGLSLDPAFPRQPHLFALYVTDEPFVHHVLSRFTVNGDTIDPASEKVLLEGDDQSKLGGGIPAGHQGGALRFGNDGKLYLSLGEQTAGEPAQALDTLQGKILRLNPEGSIPTDNPFFGETTGKYRAIYALGIRNSFGIAIQPRQDGGRVFFTDPGGSAFEEVNELLPHANYGWPRTEGFSTDPAFHNPLHAYPPVIGQSIVGGVFIPRSALWPAEWRGKFLYADFVKQWIKALDPSAPTNILNFARGLNGPVATELAPDGSLLVLNRGTIWRDRQKFLENAGSLVRIRYLGSVPEAAVVFSPAVTPSKFTPALGLPAEAAQLPRNLSRADWESRFRGAKRWPLWLNSGAWWPFVSEGHGLYLPVGGSAKWPEAAPEIQLPAGSVVVREFNVIPWSKPSFADKTGADHRRIETRLLVTGAPQGYGASYRWKTPELAELVEDGLLDPLTNLADPSSDKPVSLPWYFPGLDDGIVFPVINPAYWVSLVQTDFVWPGSAATADRPVNWLREMWRAGALESSLALEAFDAMPPGASWQSPLQRPEARVRSYLQGNCAVCHQPGGASRGLFDARITTPLAQSGLINGDLAAGDLSITGAKLVVPGSPEKSILYQRLKRTDFFRMPPVQFHQEPSPILPVMEEWIKSLR